MPTRLQNVIATRTLELTQEDGAKREVYLYIAKPRPKDDGSGYICEHQIVGIGGERIFYAGGADSLQALVLASVMLGLNVSALPEAKAGRLKCFGEDPAFNLPKMSELVRREDA